MDEMAMAFVSLDCFSYNLVFIFVLWISMSYFFNAISALF